MSAPLVFEVSEMAVLTLAIGTLGTGASMLRRYRVAGTALLLGAVAWLLAEGAHWLQIGVVMPRLEGEEHDSARFIVSMLGDALYFGIGGIGLLLLFFAAVADRTARDDRRREPLELAQRVGAQAWRYYQGSRGRRGRY
ncbi:hypothetical protein OHB26_14795 [Nocardia sp. NBC_01503]|uniref:hypothetical protein n=1 Tax=Nocardia sp. NBC_01503 TaxID=2975997 RepID=UPI002E7AFEA0|nr:hypothetical protein [Nocardia sp. NBC_01503]WTL35344.1 hypothetical protein OHB26_14795 [Nocardia sp. NBC_01503]